MAGYLENTGVTAELRRAFDKCGRFGHAWSEYHGRNWHGQLYTTTVDVEHGLCDRCGTERHFQIAEDGSVLSRHYIYPPGYGWTGPVGERPSRAQLRILAASRKAEDRRRRAERKAS